MDMSDASTRCLSMSKRKQVEVTIDVNEPPEITTAINDHSDVEDYGIERLPAADLEVEGIGFERKTVSDYTKAMKEDRMDRQLHKLGQRYEIAYILLDGDLVETDSPTRSDIQPASLRGHMASLTAREDSGVQAVIPVSNPALLADMAVRITRKHLEDSDREFIPSSPAGTDVPLRIQVFACIPGVGPDTAKSLAEEFESVGDLVNDGDFDRLTSIDGIGPTTATNILDALVAKDVEDDD